MHSSGIIRKSKKDTIIINIGEKNSIIIGCIKSKLKIIKPLFIGLQNLTDAVRDNGLSIEDWSNRNAYQVLKHSCVQWDTRQILENMMVYLDLYSIAGDRIR